MSNQKNSNARVSPKTRPPEFKKVLVAFDGSEYSKKALKTAVILAKTHDAKLLVLYVTVPPAYSYGRISPAYIDRIERIARQEAGAVVKRARQLVREADLDVKVKVTEGMLSAVQAIIEYAAKERVDLIVVGTRGMSGFKKLLLGSVSSGVVAHAHCPVLVVR
jgi:nucleotide-binding universal stress UspA family protein